MRFVFGPVPSRRLGRSVQETLAALEASGQARRCVYRGQVFWKYEG